MDAAGFKRQPSIYLILADQAKILEEKQERILCQSAHFNPTGAIAQKRMASAHV
jgi:hypothetical protein